MTNSELTNDAAAYNTGSARFTIKQRLTMMVNRYEIGMVNPDGSDGPLIAIAQQQRMAFKEQVTFYADEARTQPVFGFRARQVIDLGATYDVTDSNGMPIGSFRKDFGESLLRSTWHLTTADGLQATGVERSQALAFVRRFVSSLPLGIHFDFRAPDGSIVMSSVRRPTLRDRYDVELPTAPNGWRMDWRVGLAMAVALDSLQAR